MRLLERVDESVVVETWLRGELESPRFRDQVLAAGADEELSTAVLHRFRGEYLGDVLDGLAWWRASLTRDEVLGVRFIDWDFWNRMTAGTRLPVNLVDIEEWDAPRPESPPLILVRADASSHLVVLEGHLRLGAYAAHPGSLPDELDVFLGEGDAVARWGLY
jgi:hypothetical protein